MASLGALGARLARFARSGFAAARAPALAYGAAAGAALGGGLLLGPYAAHAQAGASTSYHQPSAASELSSSALGGGSAALAAVSAADAQAGGERTAPWPVFTKAEVAEHASKETRIWVTYKEAVYDITEFVDGHPGGSRILLAAGKSIDAFWNLYRQHVNTRAPMEMLQAMQIGVLDPKDFAAADIDLSDPFANDPKPSPALLLHSSKPLQAEPPAELITDAWITPNDLFFVRGHHPIPDIDAATYTITIKGRGIQNQTFTLEELKSKFPKHEVVTTLQCGGNNRAEFNRVRKTMGIPWGCGAMSTAKWSGARLSDVLVACGLTDEADAENKGVEHVHFDGAESMSASIPMTKAISRSGEVLLAYEMNDKPIPRAHGYPVRAIVPGSVGVRNVKWVTHVVTSNEEAQGPWQRGIAYKGFAPGVVNFENIDKSAIEKVPSVQEQPVMSAITAPRPSEIIEGETVDVKGYAWSGGGRGIVRVDVSADGGQSWRTATLREGSEQKLHKAWAWTFFEAELPVPAGIKSGEQMKIMAKATDSAYNTQPESVEAIWNVRGILYNAWSRVSVTVDRPAPIHSINYDKNA
mmetsp:Transcript_10941/g.27610  ORF Transcript_10941/g.27610 Transcript_10941/m.27610 type:complete len:582 (-) Transcript_10941:75-1820(-)